MMQKKVVIKLFILTSFIFYMNVTAQDKVKAIVFDEIFKEWKNSTKPGVAAGIVSNGEVIYLKGFGNADVQNNKKITPQTKFQVDDFAKQFTVLAILLLEKQGKISFEDDIRKYIPKLPNYQHTLRIKHLLNHSSGLNNINIIKELSGYRSVDVFTREDALKLISSQKQLNYIPGTDFSFLSSDSELILFVEIIANVSEKTFIEYTSQNIFMPLQMNNTVFNNERSILESTAVSYEIGEELKYNPVNDLTLGVTNLFTCAEDLTKWYLSYTKSSVLKQLINKLDTHVTLDNGKKFNSTFGTMTYGRYFDHSERGIQKMWQYGLIGGYASNIFRFYTEDLITFVIGNNNRYNGSPAMQMAYVFLENKFPEPAIIDFSKVKIKKISNKNLKKHEGFYWNKKSGLARQIYVKNDTLHYKRLESNRETLLVPLGKSKFQFMVNSDDKIILEFNNEKRMFSVIIGGSDKILHYEFQPIVYSSDELHDFTGTFYSKELDILYTFSLENDTITATNLKNGVVQFYPIQKNVFRSNSLRLSSIKFVRNAKDKIIGFAINTDGIKELYFNKIQP